MSGQWHPGTEALAKFRSGLGGGFRGRRLAAHVARCARCAAVIDQLSAVSSVLASVAVPSMPDAIEQRITAALATEAAARDASARGAGVPAAGAPEAGPRDAVARRPRPARHRRRAGRVRPAMVFAPVAACLLLAGFGYLLSNGASSTGPAAGSQAAAPQTKAHGSASSAGPKAAGRAISPSTGLGPLEGGRPGSFVVTESGTSYQRATLAAQVRAQLTAQGTASTPGATPAPSGSRTGVSAGSQAVGGTGFVPSQALVGCVLHLTGKVSPSLVDRATYQGRPAYVIAVPDRAWVVGMDCTASNSALITSISLAATG